MAEFDINKFYMLLKKFVTSTGIEQIQKRNGMMSIGELMKINEWGFRPIEELEYDLRSEFEMRPCGKFIYGRMTVAEIIGKVKGLMKEQKTEKPNIIKPDF